ncbi:MAG: leucyl/phenylalanyl-tRNA--protein transferase [Proteobacteria bacterium]|mgnify:FL=1|nr:leucyl/phenylalanyl-tRNA--protein transferase [Pseudomonadota bacterium]MBT5065092.1 leucyl/phenylalanyl-tRNA--protein transferase [Pseudomonadota bacterium]MBT6193260.1 leucyl/phenylalanyl-tRNA--protein transferase [Pseudomonadota bacterium]MBT6465151.1 leucyl/phenylalanyl-tRNA--protein transferase [Pseudomonadota bacterium]MBT6674528.1 leucyl/phenylalanyl-tRNA--protein transferase [Pseudomonadota bacterium]
MNHDLDNLYSFGLGDRVDQFPPLITALSYPDGLLASGGDLEPKTLLTAYSLGIFPWFEEGQPILWWSPNPRLVLYPGKFKKSRSLSKTLRKNVFNISFDTAFSEVMKSCSLPRIGKSQSSWITVKMIDAYEQLHRQGHAHSVECWREGELVGGLYGVSIGGVFFGESMFSLVPDASKVALATLCSIGKSWGYLLIDCQVESSHLLSLGAEKIARSTFSEKLEIFTQINITNTAWQ